MKKTDSKTNSAPVNDTEIKIRCWRLWLFRFLSITIVPAVLLLLVEFTLRVFDFGYPASAIIRCDRDGETVYCNNLKFGWRFFPKNIARESDSFVFPPVKSPQAYRIFVLGGSAAQGTPEPAYSFKRILEIQLENFYPGVNFEVINMAMPAINSHVVLEIAKDCARHKPDLFIVYLGNNEVLGPYGAGTVFAPVSPSLSAIRASIAVKSTKLGQLLEKLFGLFTAHRIPKTWGGMTMFLGKQVQFDSAELKYVYSHFENNLSDICKAGTDSGAKVMVCTVAANLKDCPPFASLHRADLDETDLTKWLDLYQKGIEQETAGKYKEALQKYLSAKQIDEEFAELHFRIGRCYWATDDFTKAREFYIKALEKDTLRFRADLNINEIIRSTSQGKTGKGTYFVDTEAAIEQNSPHNTTGKELIYDHVHFNFTGNYILANELFEQIEKILPVDFAQKKTNNPILSEQQCAERLAYTGWDRYRVTNLVLNGFIKKPPFTNQIYHDERVKELEQKIEALKKNTVAEECLGQYQRMVEQNPSDWRLRLKAADFFNDALGQTKTAERQFSTIIKQFPHLPHYYVYAKLGQILHRQGKFDQALEMFHKTLEMKPTFASGYYNIANVLQSKNDLKKAIKNYYKALKIDPRLSVKAYSNLAIALNKRGRIDEAEQVLREGINSFPKAASLRYNFVYFFEAHGKIDNAIDLLRQGLKIEPDNKQFKKKLEELVKKKNN